MKNIPNQDKKDPYPIFFLGINKNGEIVQFDKKCQNITGYPRDEVLNKKIIDQLIPEAHLTEWQQLINKITNNEQIENKQLPWKTSNGNEIMVTWNSLPLDEKNTTQQHYCLTGQIQNTSTPQNLEINTPLQNFRPLSDYTTEDVPYIRHIKKIEANPSINNIKTSSEKVNSLQQKYDDLEQRLKQLENKEQALITQNTQLKETITQLTNHPPPTIQKTPSQNDQYKKSQSPFNIKIKKYFKQENKKDQIITNTSDWITDKTHELKIKEQELAKKETQIEKKILELNEWKKKLIELEDEILKRYEKILQIEPPNEPPIEKKTIQKITPESLEEYNHSSAIIQRGVFKAINSELSTRFGYTKHELTDKSFYDLIAPEGLADIEQFHLDRLKGKQQPHYSTILLNKDKEKIPVKIQFEPIKYKEQKADLVKIIINKSEHQDSFNQNIEEQMYIADNTIKSNSDETLGENDHDSRSTSQIEEKAVESNNDDLTKNELQSDKKNDEKGE